MLKLRLEPERRALKSTEKRAALETDLLMERCRGRDQQLWLPPALFRKKTLAQCLQKSLGHSGGGGGGGLGWGWWGERAASGQTQPLWQSPALLAGTEQGWGTHRLRLPQSWQEVCGAGPKRARADLGGPEMAVLVPRPRVPAEAPNPPSPPQSPIPAKQQKILKL